MGIEFDFLPVLFGWVSLLLAVYFILYYKYIYSVVDPLFGWVFSTAFASYFATQVIPDTKDIIHFFGCQLALWIGFLIAYRPDSNSNEDDNQTDQTYTFSDQFLLRYTTYLLLAVFILSNIIIGYSKGFALFSANPTESKIADFQGGFGLFRKINWSAGTFVSTSLVYMYLLEKRKKDLLFLLIVVFFSSLDGSKGAFVKIAASAGVILYHPSFADKQLILKKFQRYLPLIFVIGMGIAFTVLIKENGDFSTAFLAFIKRLLYSADSLLYYYQPVNIAYFEKYTWWDYIPNNIINPIFGFLRLQEYHETPGNIMIDNLRLPDSIATVTVGPNAPFYIEGRIYFYYWAAFPFSMLLGYLYVIIRNHYFSLKRTSAFYFVFMGSVLLFSATLISDVNLAVTQLFSLAFFVIPPYIVVSFLLTNRLKINLSKLFKITKLLSNDIH
ncbi:oligosaccharide repeat unit polymerase [Spirosoma foliorum]|uniref:Oligosaccharide repeat unit polymerase n=1 Tax=Spirosoma foliorum TaxID=2710596 RepID=A0A7G5GSK3_9BACT|nr:oligosaccharide repeat unit polymerase [Spirosoma foliorum]QMW01845.1 oligosaccharide repeat unit polymerase [Spirosoma foliorum]